MSQGVTKQVAHSAANSMGSSPFKALFPQAGYTSPVLSVLTDYYGMLLCAGVTATVAGVAALYAWPESQCEEDTKNDDPTQKKKTRSKQKKGHVSSENKSVLILHHCPRGRRTPCIAFYPLKLETFLRVHGINYEIDVNGNEPKDVGNFYVTLDLEDISDTQNCFKFIVNKYGLDVEKNLGEKEKSLSTAYNHLLEHHLYWGIALWRWVYDGAKSLGDIQILPEKILNMIPDVCRTVEQAAFFHGIGRKKPEEVEESVVEDLAALSQFLGQKSFFLGNQCVTELDCSAFAMLAQILWNMDNSKYNEAMTTRFKNLVSFCWRMRKRFWPDWEDCLSNEPEQASN